MSTSGFLLVDANVLVDYQAVDLTILALVSRHVGTVHIVSAVLAEVDGLDESDCERLGFRVVEPTLEQAMEAASSNGRLSFQDRTCLVVCRDSGWSSCWSWSGKGTSPPGTHPTRQSGSTRRIRCF